MIEFERLLSGHDLRSFAKCRDVISKVCTQADFNELFNFLFHKDRVIVLHAADAIEKITIDIPGYLQNHKRKILSLLETAQNKELQWHLAVLAPRLLLDNREFRHVWQILINWVHDKTKSRLVRVGAVQGLFEMAKVKKRLLKDINNTFMEIEKEKIPSINARIRNIRKEIEFMKQ